MNTDYFIFFIVENKFLIYKYDSNGYVCFVKLFREAIREDEYGTIDYSVADIILKAKRKRQLDKKGDSRLGMMRHLYIVLDCSEKMTNEDLHPTRMICTLKVI